MTDDFSISDVNRKKAGRQEASADATRDNAYGETAWDLADRSVNPEPAFEKKAETTEESSGKNDDMSIFAGMPGFGDDEEPPKPSSLDILRLLRGVWRRRNLVVVIAMFGSILFLILAFTLLEHKWTASVVMLKKEKPDQFQISTNGVPFKQQDYSLKTMLDTLKLPSTLQATIEKSAINVIPRALSAAVSLSQKKESNIFSINVTWNDPRIAAKVANTLADEFIKSNVKIRRSDAMQIYDYYSAQLSKAESSYRDAFEKLLAFQNEFGVVNFDSQTGLLLAKVEELEVTYQTLLAELEVAENNYEAVKETFDSTPEMVVGQTIYRNPLKTKLDDLEWQLKQAKGRYTDKNPKVTELQQQVDQLKNYIADGHDENTPEEHMEKNQLKHDLNIRLINLQDQIKLKKALVDSTKGNIEKINEKLSNLTDKQREYFQLVANKDSVSGVIENLRNRVEESRVIMLSGNGDFDVVERASQPDEPRPSGRKGLVAVGFILSSGAGLFIALLLEFLSPVVLTRKEVIGITEVEKVYEIQHIPYAEQDIIDVMSPDEKIALIFRRLLNDFYADCNLEDKSSVAFVTAGRQSGKTTTLTNFCQAHALKEKTCLLVDADVSHDAGTNLAEYYEIENNHKDLLGVLRKQNSLKECISQTETNGIFLLPTFTENHSESNNVNLIGSKRMFEIVKSLKKFNGNVFYDLPPLSNYETAFEAVAEIGKAVLVVRSGICHKKEIQQIMARLKNSAVDVLAVILTDVPAELMSGKLQFNQNNKKAA